MNKDWLNITIKEITLSIYVDPRSGKAVHTNRSYHGFVLNDEDVVRDYTFSDGTVLHTKGNTLFYLPKNSTYTVKNISGKGGCYCINFDCEILDTPFLINLKNTNEIRKSFNISSYYWKYDKGLGKTLSKRTIYDIIYFIFKDEENDYVPSSKYYIIKPAIDLINADFTSNDLTVDKLAKVCGVSEVYLRKLFTKKYGVSPKEYIINKRINYSKTLLESKQFLVSEVATMCGFEEPCHFSRTFTKIVGYPPSEIK